jgi:hypothetical protein
LKPYTPNPEAEWQAQVFVGFLMALLIGKLVE